MNKIVVVSAPRSGTHMLVRMISRSQSLPWKIPVKTNYIDYIKETSWVIGVHDTYTNVMNKISDDTKVICLKRINGHRESLSKWDMNSFYYYPIESSMPKEITVIYDELIKPSETEISKIKKILNIENVEYEPWNKRYDGFADWRQNKYDENNPKLV